jgi:DNA-binding response OmpR family regulator
VLVATHVGRRGIDTGRVEGPEARASLDAARSDTTVLVVDDDPDALEIAQEFLVRANFRVLTADGGTHALEVFRAWSEKIDVVVLDLSMPDMDGDATFAEIRKIRSDTRVVIVSGFPETLAAKRFSAARAADGFLAKPYLPAALIERVRGAVVDNRAGGEPRDVFA